jgi:D-aminopeptidase
MARLGSYIGNGSGEIVVGFTTAPRTESGSFLEVRALKEECMDIPFRAIGECAEEAILKSMLCAGPDRTLGGREVPCLADYLKKL